MARGKYADLLKEGDTVLERMRLAMDVEMALVAAIRMRDVAALNSAIAKAEVIVGVKTFYIAHSIRIEWLIEWRYSICMSVRCSTQHHVYNLYLFYCMVHRQAFHLAQVQILSLRRLNFAPS
jgi:hypothetical protein